MTRMKDSGIEWIGEVPEEWGIVRLKDCLEINNGKDYKDIETDETGYPVIGSGGQFAYARKYLHDGTAILLGRKGTIDKPLYIEGKFWTVDTMFYGVPKSGINAKFIYYVALQIPFGLYSTNTALPSMTQTDLQNHHFVMPPLDEQTQITDFLDKKVAQLDKVKSLLEEQIKTLEDYRQSLIYETVTKGLDKIVPLKDSGVDWIGQIPEGWGVGKLKYYFDVQLGKMLQPSAINGNDIEIDYLRAINVQWDNISVDNLSKMWCNPSEVSKYEIINGDLLVCEGGEVGRCGIVEYLSDRAIIQNAVHRIRSAERANVRFLNYYIQHTTKSKWFDILCNKATIAHLTSEKLLNTLVVLPSISEQIRLADFLDKKTEQINQMIAIKKEQIENINKQRQTLIYDYVTGKRRV
ncbi:restriction endonuclease subunit S [Streptococcus suis]